MQQTLAATWPNNMALAYLCCREVGEENQSRWPFQPLLQDFLMNGAAMLVGPHEIQILQPSCATSSHLSLHTRSQVGPPSQALWGPSYKGSHAAAQSFLGPER